MYKLIIGNVRIAVLSDDIKQHEATEEAKKAITAAQKKGKMLSLVEISPGPHGLEVTVTEKAGTRATRKTLKQSMLDGILAATKEKFNPSSAFSQKDTWFDSDTSQEWSGSEVSIIREEVLTELEQWLETKKQH